jgi:hypothetical protein
MLQYLLAACSCVSTRDGGDDVANAGPLGLSSRGLAVAEPAHRPLPPEAEERSCSRRTSPFPRVLQAAALAGVAVSLRDGSGSTFERYGLTGVPETYVDARGRAVAHTPGEASREELERGIAAADGGGS